MTALAFGTFTMLHRQEEMWLRNIVGCGPQQFGYQESNKFHNSVKKKTVEQCNVRVHHVPKIQVIKEGVVHGIKNPCFLKPRLLMEVSHPRALTGFIPGQESPRALSINIKSSRPRSIHSDLNGLRHQTRTSILRNYFFNPEKWCVVFQVQISLATLMDGPDGLSYFLTFSANYSTVRFFIVC
jgi:hypothetical protein